MSSNNFLESMSVSPQEIEVEISRLLAEIKKRLGPVPSSLQRKLKECDDQFIPLVNLLDEARATERAIILIHAFESGDRSLYSHLISVSLPVMAFPEVAQIEALCDREPSSAPWPLPPGSSWVVLKNWWQKNDISQAFGSNAKVIDAEWARRIILSFLFSQPKSCEKAKTLARVMACNQTFFRYGKEQPEGVKLDALVLKEYMPSFSHPILKRPPSEFVKNMELVEREETTREELEQVVAFTERTVFMHSAAAGTLRSRALAHPNSSFSLLVRNGRQDNIEHDFIILKNKTDTMSVKDITSLVLKEVEDSNDGAFLLDSFCFPDDLTRQIILDSLVRLSQLSKEGRLSDPFNAYHYMHRISSSMKEFSDELLNGPALMGGLRARSDLGADIVLPRLETLAEKEIFNEIRDTFNGTFSELIEVCRNV